MAARRSGGAALVVLLLVAATASAAVPALSYPPPMHRPAATVSVKPTLLPNFSAGVLPDFYFENKAHVGLSGIYAGAKFGFSTHDRAWRGRRLFGWSAVFLHKTNFSLITSRERADLDFSDSVTRHLDASFHAAQVTFLTYNNAATERVTRPSGQLMVVVGRDRRAAAIANIASGGHATVGDMPVLEIDTKGSPRGDYIGAYWSVPTSALSNVGTPRRWAVVLDADGLPLVPAVAPARAQKLLYPMCAPPEPLVRDTLRSPQYYRSNLTSRGFDVRWFGAPFSYALVGGYDDEVRVVGGGADESGDQIPFVVWYNNGSWRADRNRLAYCLTRQANILSAVQRDVRTVVANATVRSAFMVRVDDWYWQRAPAQLVFAQLADKRLAVVFNLVNEFEQISRDGGSAVFDAGPGSDSRCYYGSFGVAAGRTVVVTTQDKSRPLLGVPLRC